MVHGTDQPTLRKGPGHYPDTPLPGQGGRRRGWSPDDVPRPLPHHRRPPGDTVIASLTYGRFVYRVEKTRIVKPTALWVKRKVRYERIILTACHPLYSAEKRIVAFARLARAERL
jgi:sortase A